MTNTNKMFYVIAVVAILVVATTIKMAGDVAAETQAQHQARKEVVCPSFLSIARSARDTLIVMRNEPLCNRYVLDNLK